MFAIYKGFTKVENVWINSCIMLCTIVSSFFSCTTTSFGKKMVPCLSHMCQLSVLVKPTKVAKNSAQQTTAFVLLLIW